MTEQRVVFSVNSEPVPKQSYRAVRGGGYTDPRVTAWQRSIAKEAREAMQGCAPFAGPVSMRVLFRLGNVRRVDLDNLNKAVCDALNGIVFVDDAQVVNLLLLKQINRDDPGIDVYVYSGVHLPLYK